MTYSRSFQLASLAAVSLACSAAVAQTPAVACPPHLESVREFIESAIAEGDRSPGVAVMVSRNGETIWAEGFGVADLETQRPVTPDTIFLLASVSKPITATGIMMLVDRRAVELDAAATTYLPKAKLRAYLGSAEDMTVRRLLSHTAGMPTHYSFFYGGSKPPPRDRTIEMFGFAAYEPGTRYNYSNLGFGVLDYITEVVAAAPWASFMEENLYGPLGMKGTSDHVRPERRHDRAQPYTVDVAGRFVAVRPYNFDHPGASAIWSSAHDLTRFLQMHINDGKLDGVRILSETSVSAMRTRASDLGDYGLGWAVGETNGHAVMNHSGGMPGVSTIISAWPDDGVTLVALTNCDSTRGIVGTVNSMVEKALVTGENRRVQLPRPNDERPPEGFYEGTWRGRIAHFDGDIPIELEIGESARLAFGENRPVRLDNVRTSYFFQGAFNAVLPIQESYQGVPNFRLQLERHSEDRITGTVFADAPRYFGISLWIDLTRVKE